MANPDPKKEKAGAPAKAPAAAEAVAVEPAPEDAGRGALGSLGADFEDIGHRAGDYLKGLASWRLIEAKSDAASEPDPILVSLKKITSWGLKEGGDEGPLPARRDSDEDPLLGPAHQAGVYLKSLDLFHPGTALVEQQRQAGAYLNRLGSVLKDAASWRGSSFRGLALWRLEGAGDGAAQEGDSLRNSLQGFVDVGRQAGDYLKGRTSASAPETGGEDAARETDPLWAPLNSLANWRISLKDLATWRLTEKPAAEPDAAPLESSLEKPFADLAHQAGDYLKGLATWRVTEPNAEPEPAQAVEAAAETEPPFNFELLSSALTRNEVRRP